MPNRRTRILIDRGLYFESPRFHDGKLWFCDTLTSKVLHTTLNQTSELVCKLNGVPSGLGFLPHGEPIIVSMFRQKLYRCDKGQPVAYVDLSKSAVGTLDDMIIDVRGRAYVGDLGFDLLQKRDGDPGPVGRILIVEPDCSVRVGAEGLHFPNGLAITGDGRTLIVAESGANRLAEFEVAADGALSLKRHFGSVREPDGICLDAEGAVWVAAFQEDAFVRIARDGRELERIDMPGRRAVACVLGGDDGRTLFCLSAETTHERLMKGDSKARIDVVSVEVPSGGVP
jgi:sugar lactone lactonase YvrE